MPDLELGMEDLRRGKTPSAKLTEAMQAALKASNISGMMLTYLGKSNDPRRNLPLLRATLPGKIALEPVWKSPIPGAASLTKISRKSSTRFSRANSPAEGWGYPWYWEYYERTAGHNGGEQTGKGVYLSGLFAGVARTIRRTVIIVLPVRGYG